MSHLEEPTRHLTICLLQSLLEELLRQEQLLFFHQERTQSRLQYQNTHSKMHRATEFREHPNVFALMSRQTLELNLLQSAKAFVLYFFRKILYIHLQVV